jgi:hypothetical protein
MCKTISLYRHKYVYYIIIIIIIIIIIRLEVTLSHRRFSFSTVTAAVDSSRVGHCDQQLGVSLAPISRHFETTPNTEIVDVSMNFSAVKTSFGITCSFEMT